nr:hypothetical protein [Tanacetum cinerariifolium]
GKNAELVRELEDIRAQFSGLQVSNEHLFQQVAALREQVSGEEKLKASFEEFKRYEDDRVEKRWVAKGMSEGLKHGVEHRHAPMDVIMAALYLESDTGGMAHNTYAISALAPYSYLSPCTRRSDGLPVSVPAVVPQGLVVLLVDGATQTDPEEYIL